LNARTLQLTVVSMGSNKARLIGALLLAFGAGAVSAAIGTAHADPQPVLLTVDRALGERLVRAEEAQVRGLELLTRATERCNKR
jgi:hypothetical protein